MCSYGFVQYNVADAGLIHVVFGLSCHVNDLPVTDLALATENAMDRRNSTGNCEIS